MTSPTLREIRTAHRQKTSRDRINDTLRAGLLVSLGLGGSIMIAAAMTEISGAVIASGQLAVESNVKKVQHPTGGTIGEIRVRDGSHVRAGEIVARLDPTQLQAGLAIVSHNLDELMLRHARLDAEHAGLTGLALPPAIADRMDQPDILHMVSAEYRLLGLRQAARNGQKMQHQERIAQTSDEIIGITAQVAAKDEQIRWIEQELLGVHDLYAKQLVQYSRLTALERERARLQGEHGSLVSSITQARGKIGEINLQINQIDQDIRSDAAKE